MFLRRHSELNAESVVPIFSTCSVGHFDVNALAQRYMYFVAAAATGAAGAATVVVFGKCSTTCNVLSLHFLITLSFSPSFHFSPSVSSIALVAARHLLRRPFAVRSAGLSLTLIHHEFLHRTIYRSGAWVVSNSSTLFTKADSRSNFNSSFSLSSDHSCASSTSLSLSLLTFFSFHFLFFKLSLALLHFYLLSHLSSFLVLLCLSFL